MTDQLVRVCDQTLPLAAAGQHPDRLVTLFTRARAEVDRTAASRTSKTARMRMTLRQRPMPGWPRHWISFEPGDRS